MTVVKFRLLRYPLSPKADPIPLDNDVMGTYGYAAANYRQGI